MSTETARSINLEKREQNYTESDMKRNCEKENTIKEIHLGFLNIFSVCMCGPVRDGEKLFVSFHFSFLSLDSLFFFFVFHFIFGWDSLRFALVRIIQEIRFSCPCVSVSMFGYWQIGSGGLLNVSFSISFAFRQQFQMWNFDSRFVVFVYSHTYSN